MLNKNRSAGFTLIELVIVIVILGILSAFALPRFADLGSNARAAVFEGIVGTVRSSIGITHSKALATQTTGATGSVTVEGATVDMQYGYPSLTGIETAFEVDSEDYAYDNTTGVLSVGSCEATYTAAADTDTPAAIEVTTAPVDSEC